MDIERERGITIKSQAVTLPYRGRDGKDYLLNLIDTPGHVDFSYEVSRSLASCEGVLLLIDAAQGVQAQTIANLYLAMENNLVIIPVINKIDLPTADVERVSEQIDSELGLDPDSSIQCSAKEGWGIEEVLEAIVQKIPPPKGDPEAPLAALIFDAKYDSFRGTLIYCRLFEGSVKSGDIIRFVSNLAIYKVEEVGRFSLYREKLAKVSAGEVGYIIAGVKTVSDVHIGDTITSDSHPCAKSLPGFKDVKPVVFSSIYPISSDDYEDLEVALEKYKLNDAALTYQKDSSVALGQGFRCGFLGLLHLDIVQERLEREYNLSIILSVPSVRYRFTLKDGGIIAVDNPAYYPNPISIVQRAYDPDGLGFNI
jgi:GTP-binding protein LepA